MSQSSRIRNRSSRYNVPIFWHLNLGRFVEARRQRDDRCKVALATMNRRNVAGEMAERAAQFNALPAEKRKAVLAA